VIGRPRLRQLRVSAEGCDVPQVLERKGLECFWPYASNNMQTKSDPEGTWKPAYRAKYNLADVASTVYPMAFDFVDSTGSPFVSTTFKGNYGTGGYIQRFDVSNGTAARELLQTLIDINWMDYNHTKAMFAEIALYNANTNLFMSMQVLCEVGLTGGIVPSVTYRVVNLYRHGRTRSLIDLTLEMIMYAMVFYLLFLEISNLRKDRKKYFKDGYNWLSLLNMIIFVVVLCLEIYTISAANTLLNERTNEDLFDDASLNSLMFWTYQVYNWNAFNALLTWMRLLKYLDLISQKTKQLSATLAMSSQDVFVVLLIFVVIYFGYALAFYLAFGQDVEDFVNIENSLLSLFLTILGAFNFNELNQSNRILGPMLFATYVVVMVFLILNMFLTVIMKKYDDVTVMLQQDQDELPSHIRAVFARTVRKAGAAVGGQGIANLIVPKKPEAAADANILTEAELAEIFVAEKDKLSAIGIMSVDHLVEVADTDLDGYISVDEIMAFKSQLEGAAGEEQEEDEEEETYLLMKILERTNAIISEEKQILHMLQVKMGLTLTSNGGGATLTSVSRAPAQLMT